LKRAIQFFFVFQVFLTFASGAAHSLSIEAGAALLQGLDKVTARVSTFEANLNQEVRFGTLEVIVKKCVKTPPEETPESAAFLEIRDIKPGQDLEILFTGWMFASSPSLSAMQHPVYDVWVIGCLD
tara:strand:- start:1134 stop:1511 length:378 start_codon:yes stop_codon:yes gene_type:complete